MLQNLAVQAKSSLVKIALNADAIILAQTDAVISFSGRVILAHLVNTVRPLFLI